MPKVFLSAGHGGKDPGAVGNGIKEKDANLNILLACKEMLEANGIQVVCSRTKDEDDPVGQEVREANTSGAELAVSFHNNAGGGDGFEAFCMLNNKYAVRLVTLAIEEVHKLGQNDHGNPLKSGSHLYFIKNTKMTSVLFESFFVDNAKDAQIGDTVEEQRAFGRAYAKAILKYFHIFYKDEEKAPENGSQSVTEGANIIIENEKGETVDIFLVKVQSDSLNIRTGAGVEYATTGEKITNHGTYTIVETKKAKDGGIWGRLKSGAGWINISAKYVTKL